MLPDAIHAAVLAACFNHLMRGQSLAARLGEIEGKSVLLHIRDTHSRIHLRVSHRRLLPAFHDKPDVTISGNLDDFWKLATRREDPDTLFFRRNLCIEGETETGVHIKNLLDALEYDWDAHFDAVLFPGLAVIARQLRKKACKYTHKKSFR